ncbi:hypothetical protein CMEL01_15349 [Colletotrichum melonis]|uniref:Uncharacterized protein n=1 Tax=Colletotrichum melonis TaxID=1209925 RepID=A0AAI9UJ40_9PEZI|nr:hypothetical protein CMEL01_15349 [Colletotrichum melonis]
MAKHHSSGLLSMGSGGWSNYLWTRVRPALIGKINVVEHHSYWPLTKGTRR